LGFYFWVFSWPVAVASLYCALAFPDLAFLRQDWEFIFPLSILGSVE